MRSRTLPEQPHFDEINKMTLDVIISENVVIYGSIVYWKIDKTYGFIRTDKRYAIFKQDFYTDIKKTDGNMQFPVGTVVSFKVGRTKDSGKQVYAYSVVMVVE